MSRLAGSKREISEDYMSSEDSDFTRNTHTILCLAGLAVWLKLGAATFHSKFFGRFGFGARPIRPILASAEVAEDTSARLFLCECVNAILIRYKFNAKVARMETA